VGEAAGGEGVEIAASAKSQDDDAGAGVGGFVEQGARSAGESKRGSARRLRGVLSGARRQDNTHEGSGFRPGGERGAEGSRIGICDEERAREGLGAGSRSVRARGSDGENRAGRIGEEGPGGGAEGGGFAAAGTVEAENQQRGLVVLGGLADGARRASGSDEGGGFRHAGEAELSANFAELGRGGIVHDGKRRAFAVSRTGEIEDMQSADGSAAQARDLASAGQGAAGGCAKVRGEENDLGRARRRRHIGQALRSHAERLRPGCAGVGDQGHRVQTSEVDIAGVHGDGGDAEGVFKADGVLDEAGGERFLQGAELRLGESGDHDFHLKILYS